MQVTSQGLIGLRQRLRVKTIHSEFSGRNRSISILIAVSALLSINVEEARARALYLRSQASVPAGDTAMLNLRIPFGALRKSESKPRLTFAYGPSWRDAPGPAHGGVPYFMPNVEAGLTLGGNPILSLGSIDLMKSIGARINASSEPNSGSGNRALYVIAAVVAVGLVVWGVNRAWMAMRVSMKSTMTQRTDGRADRENPARRSLPRFNALCAVV